MRTDLCSVVLCFAGWGRDMMFLDFQNTDMCYPSPFVCDMRFVLFCFCSIFENICFFYCIYRSGCYYSCFPFFIGFYFVSKGWISINFSQISGSPSPAVGHFHFEWFPSSVYLGVVTEYAKSWGVHASRTHVVWPGLCYLLGAVLSLAKSF